MDDQYKVLCIGEILWDSLPSGLYLGGAPLNVCYHMNRFGIDATISSRVGDDRLGREAIRRINHLGISTDLIQKDKERETGFVLVEIAQSGDPYYDIVEPVAWDHIEFNSELEETIKEAWGVVFGSLAQRNETSKKTIQKLWHNEVQLIFDMNLRKPFVDKSIVQESLKVADVVKMNEDELNQLIEWYSLSGSPKKAVRDLADHFNNSIICVTRGANGSMLFLDGEWFEHKGFPVKAKDVVGAGDAFLSALIYGIVNKKEGKDMLACANATGSLIAQKDGATPDYDLNEVLSEMD